MSCSYLYLSEQMDDEAGGTELKSNPIFRIGHICESYGKYILVWGGQRTRYDPPGSDSSADKNLVWIFDTEFEKWVLIECKDQANCPTPLSGMASLMVDGSIWLFGGSRKQSFFNGLADNYFNQLYKLNLKTFNWERISSDGDKWPSPRDKSSGWFFKNRLYFFGGFGPSFRTGDKYLNQHGQFEEISHFDLNLGWNNQLICYDIEEKQWQDLSILGYEPKPRAAHTCTKLNDSQLIIFGGRTKESRSNDLHVLDLETFTCSRNLNEGLREVPSGRSWHTMIKVDEQRLFLYGGLSDQNEALGDAWLLNVRLLQWTKIERSFEPRLWHTARTGPEANSQIYIIGGSLSEIYYNEPKFPRHALKISLTPESLQRKCIDIICQNINLYSKKVDQLELPSILKEKLKAKMGNELKLAALRAKSILSSRSMNQSELCNIM